MTILWWSALLSLWSCASVALLVYAEAKTLLAPGVAILSLVITAGLLYPRWLAPVTIAGIVIYSGLWISLERYTGNPATVLAALTTYGGAFWLSRGLHFRVREIYRALSATWRRVQELSVHEENTGALRLEHGLELLAEEVERCRRYHRNLSLLRLGVAAPEEWLQVHGQAEQQTLARSLAEAIRENLRIVDKVIQCGTVEYLIILPETPLEAASTVAHRLARFSRERVSSEIRIGVAEFPTSGLSAEDLMEEAESALAFARISELTVAMQESNPHM